MSWVSDEGLDLPGEWETLVAQVDPEWSGGLVEPSPEAQASLPESSGYSSSEVDPLHSPMPQQESLPHGDALLPTSEAVEQSTLAESDHLVQIVSQLEVLTWGTSLILVAVIVSMFALMRR